MNDISTDLDDPPRFQAVSAFRPAYSNPLEYGGPEVAAKQRRIYPAVKPIDTPLGPRAAFQRALETAAGRGWRIVAADAASGIIEAIATTPLLRFKDDVVVRVRATATGSRVDLRSRSRIGLSDLGKNAARIMAYRQAFLAD